MNIITKEFSARTDISPAILEPAEADATEDLILASLAGGAGECGFSTMRFGSTVAIASSRLDTILFNRVLGLGAVEPITMEAIEACCRHYADRSIGRFVLQIAPAALAEGVGAGLIERGWSDQGSWCKLYRRLDGDALPALDAGPVVTAMAGEHTALFGTVVCAGFGIPEMLREPLGSTIGREGWRHYLAWDGGLPIAGAALHVRDGAAWLGMAATLPGRRGRGAQSALIARRLADAVLLGCHTGVSETGDDTPEHPNGSYRNMIRAGFTLAYRRSNLSPPPPQ